MKIQFLADRPELVPIIARWYFNEWGHREPGNSFERTCERLKGKLNRDKLPIPVIAAEEDGTLLGTAQLKLREMDIFPEREIWLGSVYVTPAARGRKIATALVEKIASLAIELHVQELWLQTAAADGGLYKRLGWEIFERLEHHGTQTTVMCRRLAV